MDNGREEGVVAWREMPEYWAWNAMKQRTGNPNHAHYKYYGARGIKICERWRKFENFIADMGRRPAGKSLDRINNDGNYEPGNCRWATHSQQIRNRPPRALRTHCRRGLHPLAGSNLVIRDGWRICRECKLANRRANEYPKRKIA